MINEETNMPGCVIIAITPLVENSVLLYSLPVICNLAAPPPGISAAEAGFFHSVGDPTNLARKLEPPTGRAGRRHATSIGINHWKKFATIICLAATMIAACSAQETSSAKAQETPAAATAPAKADAAIDNAGKKGVPLAVTSNVADEASLQAVLIPAGLARRIFGKEVAQNYAVVEVIISNRDTKASLVVHSVFLDYSKWLLSGTSNANRKPLSGLDPSQAATISSQVASIESRLVRGELLDAQQWTARNWTIRTLTFLGTTAVAFEFPFSTDVAKGIGAFNGTVVPGASTLWPDGTVNQINRISDFGFQTNKIIPKQSSDILVAFFPIDRFLTKGFRDEFLKDTAAWFVPSEMLADPKTEPEFEKIAKPLVDGLLANIAADSPNGDSFKGRMLKAMLAPCSPTSASGATSPANGAASTTTGADSARHQDEASCQIQNLLNGISLNNIHVVIEGAMTVDVNTVPATIYGVDFKNGNLPSIWTTTGTEQAVSITGVYLANGVPAVEDASGKAIDGITVTPIPDDSTDTEIDFTIKVTKCIAPGTKIYFVVNKSLDTASVGAAKPANTVASTPFEFTVQPSTPCPAANDANGGAVAPVAGDKPAPDAAAPPATAPVKKEQNAGASAKG
jgi:uncharacterized Zn-binding protein involved in type VI secretion